jgi:hypothetical protein
LYGLTPVPRVRIPPSPGWRSQFKGTSLLTRCARGHDQRPSTRLRAGSAKAFYVMTIFPSNLPVCEFLRIFSHERVQRNRLVIAFAVSSFAAPAPSGVKQHALPSDTAAIALFPVRLLLALYPSSGPGRCRDSLVIDRYCQAIVDACDVTISGWSSSPSPCAALVG